MFKTQVVTRQHQTSGFTAKFWHFDFISLTCKSWLSNLFKLSFLKQGTTGNPKGATLSHHGILNNAHYVGEILNYENQVIFFKDGGEGEVTHPSFHNCKLFVSWFSWSWCLIRYSTFCSRVVRLQKGSKISKFSVISVLICFIYFSIPEFVFLFHFTTVLEWC